MVHAERWSSRTYSIEQHLPHFLIQTLRLEGLRLRNEELARTNKEALLGSGFLTNASIAITNLPRAATNEYSTCLEVVRRLRLLRGRDYWAFYMRSNQAIITCRPCELEHIKGRVETP
jgi:hypothetical protein